MIDLKAARANPEAVRAALARKGAAEAFDRLLEADERWRALVPRVDELRARTKLKGKPTPEQLEELQAVKAELKDVEEALAAAEAERDELALRVPNLPHDDVPGRLDRGRRPRGAPRRRATRSDRRARARRHRPVRHGARSEDVGARFGYWVGDTALLALALYRFALDRLAARASSPCSPRCSCASRRSSAPAPSRPTRPNVYELPADDLYLAGTAEIPLASLHTGEILVRGRAAAPLRRVLAVLPA